MDCLFCGEPDVHKHGVTSSGTQRYWCPACGHSYTESFDTLYYRRKVTPAQVAQVLQAYAEGCSQRGISRLTGLAYNTVVSILRSVSEKALMIHQHEVTDVKTQSISADEMWTFVKKNRSTAKLERQKPETAG